MRDPAAGAQASGSRYTRFLVPRSWPLAWLPVATVAELTVATAALALPTPTSSDAHAHAHAPPQTQARTAVVFSGPAFGSRYTVRVVMPGGDEAANERVRAAIAGQIALADRLFSGWNPASEISRLNAHASTEPFPVSRETLDVLELGRRASELSQGAFDASVFPLVDAWGFGPRGGARTPPSDHELAALRARVGYRLLALDAARSTVAKGRPDVTCDVSAIGDGWAADRIARAIVALGHPDVLVDVGGEVAARGRRADGGRWRVAVEWPDGAKEHTLVLELADAGVATSGDYRKGWTDEQGRRVSHIIDPRTGRPVAHDLASVSVVDADGAWADALATTLMVLGPDAGRALAARERLAARFVVRERDGRFAEWSTPAFESVVAAPGPSAPPRRP
jgi:thiamine biosynthesis lipoprotein